MTAPNTNSCAVCGGAMIGDEIAHGTCGHCGGRSLNPNRRREIATITTATEPSPEELDGIVAAYREEGYEEIQAVPFPVSFEAAHTPWETKVFAEGNPYARARA